MAQRTSFICLLGILAIIHSTALANGNLVSNSDFSALGGSGLPILWSYGSGDYSFAYSDTEYPAGKSQSLTATVGSQSSSSQGYVQQQIYNIKPHHQYRLTGWVHATIDDMAFLQFKRLNQGAEINRVSSQRNSGGWTYIEMTFDSLGANQLMVLGRFVRTAGYTNQTAYFADIRLFEDPDALLRLPLTQNGEQADSSIYDHSIQDTNLSWGAGYLSCNGNQEIDALGLPSGNVLSNGVSFGAWVKIQASSTDRYLPLIQWDGILSCGIEVKDEYTRGGIVTVTVQTNQGPVSLLSDQSEQCVTYDQWVYVSVMYKPGVDPSDSTMGEHGLTVWVAGTKSEPEALYIEHQYGSGNIASVQTTDVQILHDGQGNGFVGQVYDLRLAKGYTPVDILTRQWVDGNNDTTRITTVPSYINASTPTDSSYTQSRWLSGEIVCTFESAGIALMYHGDSNDNSTATVRYRIDGGAWIDGMNLIPDRAGKCFRGSVMYLSPDSQVQVECTLHDNDQQTQSHAVILTGQTWSNAVTQGSGKTATAGMTISDQGNQNSWVVYTAPGPLDSGTTADQTLNIVDAAYVVIRDMTILGGKKHGIRVTNSHHIRIENCNISGWGVAGILDANGFYIDPNDNNRLINNQAGIYVESASSQIVIQNNLIHSPRGTSNTWTVGHPAGQQAVMLRRTGGNHVIRDNDMMGNEEHWLNDVIGSIDNSKRRGGPYRDTDIYNNIMAYSADDGIELDGGQINVRMWDNWITRCFVGISTALNRGGPCYIWRNVIDDMGDVEGNSGSALKLGGNKYIYPGLLSLWHNTVIAPNLAMKDGLYDGGGPTPVVSRNNIFAGRVANHTLPLGVADLDYDLVYQDSFLADPVNWEINGFEGAMDFLDLSAGDWHLTTGSVGIDVGIDLGVINADYTGAGSDIGAMEGQTAAIFPYRENGLNVSKNRLIMDYVKGQPAQTTSVQITVPEGETWQTITNGDWFSASPASGTGSQSITITATTTGLLTQTYEGTLSVRSQSGRVRTVFMNMQVYDEFPQIISFEAEDMNPINLSIGNDTNAYGDSYVYRPDGGSNGSLSATFTISQPGDYYFIASHTIDGNVADAGAHDSWYIRVDNTQNPLVWNNDDIWDWASLKGLWAWGNIKVRADGVEPLKRYLTAGTHRIDMRTRESLAWLDRITITNQPYLNDKTMFIFEAENSTTSTGFNIVSDSSASGGQYISAPGWGQGIATYTFNVTVAGTYYINALCLTPPSAGSHDSFRFKIDTDTEAIWDVSQSQTQWQWDLIQVRGNSLPNAYNLSQGMHTLTLLGRESDTRIDKLFISNLPYGNQ